MALAKKYEAESVETNLGAVWQTAGVYHFQDDPAKPILAIDTPPPTVSGKLHLGHTFSYSHTDFMARFWRMNGFNVFYPMGYDDNGLPTERLVEKTRGVRAAEVGRAAFIKECLTVSETAERDYQALWQRLGLSIDWRYTYRTIDDRSRRISQRSFADLYRRGLAYRRRAPGIWCPECRTAIAQAELNDLERETTFYTLTFELANGRALPIATTRPELLPACVAVFVHPDDDRYRALIGAEAIAPLFEQRVPILADPAADPQKGTGAVMCCTFGDTTDIAWQRAYELPLIEAIDQAGRMTDAAGSYAGMTTTAARRRIVENLAAAGYLLDETPLVQSVRVHERCDTPVEYRITPQWFIRVLENKEAFLAAGEKINWFPAHMETRYRQWVENLNWDWCISRQRAFGVPFPIWYCRACGETMLADDEALPVDPVEQSPGRPCACGSKTFEPETDVMDTWATSSMTPQIVAGWLLDLAPGRPALPLELRPQAHEIIRTWAFYSIVKSHYHDGAVPWRNVAISGWALAPEGTAKLSKSRGGGPMSPMEMIERYSADAVRYWAAGAGPGKDTMISEERVQAGARLVNKLWNVARFSERFLTGYTPAAAPEYLTTADRWILARQQELIAGVTGLFRAFDYASARSEIEVFFWRDLADNYLEMVKQRLYEGDEDRAAPAAYALHRVLSATIKLLAPILPYVTEAVYLALFAAAEGNGSIHRASWPVADESLHDIEAIRNGELLVEIAAAVRRFKSDRNMSLAAELNLLQFVISDDRLLSPLNAGVDDLMSITRVGMIEFRPEMTRGLTPVYEGKGVRAAVAR